MELPHAERLTLAQAMLLDAARQAGCRFEIQPHGEEWVSLLVFDPPEALHELLLQHGFKSDEQTWRWTNKPTGSSALASYGLSANKPHSGSVPPGTIYTCTDTDEVWVATSGGWVCY